MKQRENGFTLIELIAVLAILAILASAVIPNVANEVTTAIAQAEDQSLASIHKALDESIIDTRVIPGTAVGQWDTSIAVYLSIPASQISSNNTGGGRRLIMRASNDLGAPPYNQSVLFAATGLPQEAMASGALPRAMPLQSRMVIVSNIEGDAPTDILTNDQFDAVWRQAGDFPVGFAMTNKLRIERISFVRFFHAVTVSCSSVVNAPQWSIDTAAPKTLNVEVFTVYLITGTLVNLFVNGAAAGTIVVNGPLGLTFNGTSWNY